MTVIQELHRTACEMGADTYKDPGTGYQVFTEYALLKKGDCCGNACRHCPYGHIKVNKPGHEPKVKKPVLLGSIEDMREGAARQYPLGGIQSAEQVADVMAFLLGDGAARLTGQVIAVDGGFTTVRPLVR